MSGWGLSMANLGSSVNQEDLQQLSAMLDGEISDEQLDALLERMAQEPALGEAWTRLCQIQAASHRHVQSGFHGDLSGQIAEKLGSSTSESTPTPVVHLWAQGSCSARPELYSVDSQNDPVNDSLGEHLEEGVSSKKEPKKGFRRQMLAHLAVAASVASITVWVQNSLIEQPQMASAPVQEMAPVATEAGTVPSALRSGQALPLTTVGSDLETGAEDATVEGTDAHVESIGNALQQADTQ